MGAGCAQCRVRSGQCTGGGQRKDVPLWSARCHFRIERAPSLPRMAWDVFLNSLCKNCKHRINWVPSQQSDWK